MAQSQIYNRLRRLDYLGDTDHPVMIGDAELAAHRLVSKADGREPDCYVQSVKVDADKIIVMAARILRHRTRLHKGICFCNECQPKKTIVTDGMGNPMPLMVNSPIERAESTCPNCDGPARDVTEHHKYCDKCGCSDG